jgi:hypothetical protein
MKGTRFGMMLFCIRRRMRACMKLTEAAKALATRDHVRSISRLSANSALSNKSDRVTERLVLLRRSWRSSINLLA